jgi:hypothetical protein
MNFVRFTLHAVILMNTAHAATIPIEGTLPARLSFGYEIRNWSSSPPLTTFVHLPPWEQIPITGSVNTDTGEVLIHSFTVTMPGGTYSQPFTFLRRIPGQPERLDCNVDRCIIIPAVEEQIVPVNYDVSVTVDDYTLSYPEMRGTLGEYGLNSVKVNWSSFFRPADIFRLELEVAGPTERRSIFLNAYPFADISLFPNLAITRENEFGPVDSYRIAPNNYKSVWHPGFTNIGCLDGLCMTVHAVPEPSSWLLAAIGVMTILPRRSGRRWLEAPPA